MSGEPSAVNRRDCLETVTAGAAGLAVMGEFAFGQAKGPQPSLTRPKQLRTGRYPLTPPRTYRDQHVRGGGHADRRHRHRHNMARRPGTTPGLADIQQLQRDTCSRQLLCRRACAGSGEPVTRVLQTSAEASLQPMASLDYEGGYPIARLTFHDPGLPVEMQMEAFNPMIPLDAKNSAITGGDFRLTARNPGKEAAEVTLLATLQNAVGGQAARMAEIPFGIYETLYDAVSGQAVAGIPEACAFEMARNRVLRNNAMVAVNMDVSQDSVSSGPVKICAADGGEIRGRPLHWLTDASALSDNVVKPMARTIADGGAILVGGASASFFQDLAALRSGEDEGAVFTAFEDFESGTYKGWRASGKAFGQGPCQRQDSRPRARLGLSREGPG